MQYVVKHVGLVLLHYGKLPENDTPVAKHLGVLTLVMKCILLGAFFGVCVCVCVCIYIYIYIYIYME